MQSYAQRFCALSSLWLPLKLFGSVLSNSKPRMRRDATLGRTVELVICLCSIFLRASEVSAKADLTEREKESLGVSLAIVRRFKP